MNKIVFYYFLLTLPNLIVGQSIFEKYQNNNEVTTINISPKMFQLLGRMSIPNDDSESKELIKMVNGIWSFKVLITSSSDIIKEIERSAESISKKESLDEIVKFSEETIEMILYGKLGKDEGELETLLMFSYGSSSEPNTTITNRKKSEGLLLQVKGEISLESFSKLINRMNLPGSNQFKKAGI
tara:strand:- start:193 stop:744 length:552 start_codon:yes stop_codon:yes gene_type:complete